MTYKIRKDLFFQRFSRWQLITRVGCSCRNVNVKMCLCHVNQTRSKEKQFSWKKTAQAVWRTTVAQLYHMQWLNWKERENSCKALLIQIRGITVSGILIPMPSHVHLSIWHRLQLMITWLEKLRPSSFNSLLWKKILCGPGLNASQHHVTVQGTKWMELRVPV